MTIERPVDRLRIVLRPYDSLTVAVSGGVDSMTLAHVAHGITQLTVFHAVSPAVPMEATARVKHHAAEQGWRLTVAEAGEMSDARYLTNPQNRCYFCKTNLYDRIRANVGDAIVASGANLDDLGDYRPGLLAARERDVVHPLIEAQLTKRDVRDVAAKLGLTDLAELPAQPCLSSRIETGISINAGDLAFVEQMEMRARALLPDFQHVRCRIRSVGVVLEVDDPEDPRVLALREMAAAAAHAHGSRLESIQRYRMGSAFLKR